MKMSLFSGLFLLAMVGGVAAEEPVRLIADFNAPAPNNLGGNFGAFGPENDDGSACQQSIDDGIHRGTDGASLRLDYNVSKKGSYNGFWMKLGPGDSGNNFDATGYSKLSLWVKGDEKSGIPTRMKLEVKGDQGPIAMKYVGDLKNRWTKIEIPLRDFAKQGVDLSKLNEFCIVFEQNQTGPTTVGSVHIDDVVLEK